MGGGGGGKGGDTKMLHQSCLVSYELKLFLFSCPRYITTCYFIFVYLFIYLLICLFNLFAQSIFHLIAQLMRNHTGKTNCVLLN